MRKDSWFRGVLLSALFFALLIGGAPSIASAIHTNGGITPGSGGEAGANQGGTAHSTPPDRGPGLWNSFKNWACGFSANTLLYGGIGAGIGGAMTVTPEPVSSVFGPPLAVGAGLGAALGGIGTIAFC